MSEQTGTPPTCERPPLPLPVSAAPARRRRAFWIAGALIALLVLGSCVGVVGFLAVTVSSAVEQQGRGDMPWAGTRTMWADDGRYLVAQVADETDEPLIVVWEERSGRRRTLRGYSLVSVEPSAPVAWLAKLPEPDPDQDPDEEEPFVAGSEPGADAAVGRVFTWRLDESSSKPRGARSGSWRPLDGRAGVAAVCTVDAEQGAWPSRLELVDATGVRRPVVGVTGDGIRSFRPVGWSPSGSYFAVIGIGEPESEYRPPANPGTAAVLLISASTGHIVQAVTDVPHDTLVMEGTCAAWDASRDLLYMVRETTPGEGNSSYRRLVALTTDGRQVEAPEALHWRAPDSWTRSFGGAIAGSDATGPVVAFTEEEDALYLFRLRASGPERLWDANVSGVWQGAWSSRGFAAIGESYDDDADVSMLHEWPTEGGAARTLWRSETE